MSTMTEAFTTASGSDPARMRVVILLILCTVVFVVLAYVAMRLWDAFNEGQLRAYDAKQHSARAVILVMVLLAVLLW